MTRRLTAALAVTLLLAGPIQAMPPQPGPGWVAQDGGWLPPGHPNIRASAPMPADDIPNVPGCERVNVYEQPEVAMLCAERYQRLHPSTPVPRPFTLGSVYQHLYSGQQILIIGRALGLDGQEVITGQVVAPASALGTPVAFVSSGSGAGLWYPAVASGR